jgi:catechol 2,3-dioxygenase-like lactoylglutathione lyase family enzyme
MAGGGGFEIWQYTSRVPELPKFEPQLGDFGIYITKIKCGNVEKEYQKHKDLNLNIIGNLTTSPNGSKHYFLKDPYGSLFEIIESNEWFTKPNGCGGVAGCTIGVSDITKARTLYSDILGYDKVEFDKTDNFDDLIDLPSGSKKFRRVLLKRSEPTKGSFSELLGSGEIELIEAKDREPKNIFENRFWGDRGFIHLCFDIKGMKELEKECTSAGYPFTIDSSNVFDMGEASGHFSYIEDPDGTLIEFVETQKIPIVKKIGWYLTINKGNPEKRLPRWLLKMLSFNRIKD